MRATGWPLLLEKSPMAISLKATNKSGSAAAKRHEARSISGADSIPAFETLFFGLSLGSVLVLIAIGLAITFGVMGVINMAHGELMMLGAYTTYVVQVAMPGHVGISILVAIPAAFIVSGRHGHFDRANHHSLSLRATSGDAARNVRPES